MYIYSTTDVVVSGGSLKGTGGKAFDTTNSGVYVPQAALAVSGNGSVTGIGDAYETATQTKVSYGVLVGGVLSVSGDGSVTGIGGSANATATDNSYGVFVGKPLSTTSSELKVTGGSVTGTGGAAVSTGSSCGVSVGNATYSAGNLSVSGGSVTGTGGSAEDFEGSYGLYCHSNKTICLTGGTTLAVGNTSAVNIQPKFDDAAQTDRYWYKWKEGDTASEPAGGYEPSSATKPYSYLSTHKYLEFAPKLSLTGVTLSPDTPPAVGWLLSTKLAPEGATATYRWYRSDTQSTTGGTEISSATGARYTPTTADEGKYIYVTATGSSGFTGSVSAVTTSKVSTALTGVTLSTNTPAVGTRITATPAPAGATVSYQWFRDTETTPVGTGSSYTPTNADWGKTIKVVITGTGSYTGTADAATTDTVRPSAELTPSSSFVKGGAPANERLVIGDGLSGFNTGDLTQLKVDGREVSAGAGTYSVSTGSLIITFAQSYLNGLTVGTHSLEVTLGGTYAGTYTTTLTVRPVPAPSPSSSGRANPSTGV